MWTKSACVLLAWSIVLIVTAAGPNGPARPAQANNRTANSTLVITLTSTRTAPLPLAAAARAAAKTARYVVQPGDTLSGIAARFGLPGGWRALYAANRMAIGADPDVIGTGIVLVIPGQAHARHSARTPAPPAAHPGHRPHQPPPATRHPGRRVHQSPPSSGGRHGRAPTRTNASAAMGMPAWLTSMLLAVGVLIGGAFLLYLVMAAARRQQKAAAHTVKDRQVPAAREPASVNSAEARARIVFADHDRLIVTHSAADDTVYVLRPPGEDPTAILQVARLVLAEGRYRDLAEHLGLPASWPIILADYHRLVVTHSAADNTVCVLRPPGEDPMAVLRAARLVLHEEPYEELASQLGVPASWPLE